MRISDDRYQRDRQRLDVAVSFIEREARTQTIRRWTGLTDDRIRKLYRSYLAEREGRLLPRHRGKSPHQIAHFMRTSRLRQESALFASLCLLTGVLAPTTTPAVGMGLGVGVRAEAAGGRGGGQNIQRARQLCQAYDTYRDLVGQPMLSFEHAVFLVTALGRGDELRLAGCADCEALVVADRLSLRVPRCAGCLGASPGAAMPSQLL